MSLEYAEDVYGDYTEADMIGDIYDAKDDASFEYNDGMRTKSDGNIESYLDALNALDTSYEEYKDYDTTNDSFLDIAIKLLNLGVKNCDFMLQIYQPELKGIDPYDTDKLANDPELQYKIYFEIVVNKFYFIREVVRIPDAEPLKYELNLGSLAFHWLRSLNINVYLELPRQCGKSIAAVVECVYIFLTGRNTKIGAFCYSNEMVKENIDRVTQVLNLLPPYLQFHNVEPKAKMDKATGNLVTEYKLVAASAARKMSATMKLFGNTITGKTPGRSKSEADAAGRGKTYLFQWWDEPCSTHNLDTAFNAAFPSYVTIAKKAESANKSFGIMITSTPPDISTPHGEFLVKFAKVQMPKFNHMFYDYSPAKLRKVLNRHKDGNGFFFISYSYIECGKSIEWYKDQIEKLDEAAIRRDIELIWEKHIVDSPYDMNMLKKIAEETARSHYEIIELSQEGTYLKVYCAKTDYSHIPIDADPDTKALMMFEAEKKNPGSLTNQLEYMKRHRILIVSDVAGGLGGDSDASTLVGINIESSDLLFTFESNKIQPPLFANMIGEVIDRIAPRAVIVVERNNLGDSILSFLCLLDNEKYKPNVLFMPVSKDSAVYGTGTTHRPGIWQTKTMRQMIFGSILTDRISRFKRLFRSDDIYGQITNLTKINGRIDHRRGSHDDLLMAYLIGIYTLVSHFDIIRSQFDDLPLKAWWTDDLLNEYFDNHDIRRPSNGDIYNALNHMKATYDDVFINVSQRFDLKRIEHDLSYAVEVESILNRESDDEDHIMQNILNTFGSNKREQGVNLELIKNRAKIENERIIKERAREAGFNDDEFEYYQKSTASQLEEASTLSSTNSNGISSKRFLSGANTNQHNSAASLFK